MKNVLFIPINEKENCPKTDTFMSYFKCYFCKYHLSIIDYYIQESACICCYGCGLYEE